MNPKAVTVQISVSIIGYPPGDMWEWADSLRGRVEEFLTDRLLDANVQDYLVSVADCEEEPDETDDA